MDLDEDLVRHKYLWFLLSGLGSKFREPEFLERCEVRNLLSVAIYVKNNLNQEQFESSRTFQIYKSMPVEMQWIRVSLSAVQCRANEGLDYNLTNLETLHLPLENVDDLETIASTISFVLACCIISSIPMRFACAAVGVEIRRRDVFDGVRLTVEPALSFRNTAGDLASEPPKQEINVSRYCEGDDSGAFGLFGRAGAGVSAGCA